MLLPPREGLENQWEVIDVAPEKRSLEQVMEDYALEPVPREYANTVLAYLAMAGVPQSMYYLAVGSVPVAMAGLVGGVAAFVGAGVIMAIMAYVFGMLSYRHGYSYDMLARLYGWGHKGSFIPSLLSAVGLMAFWVLEAYWMAKALETLYPLPIWIYYIALTILFIIVPLFGHKMMGWFGTVTFPLGILATLYGIAFFYTAGGFSLEALVSMVSKPMMPGGLGGALDWSLLAIGLWGVTLGNLGRFCQTERAAKLAGPVMALLAHGLFPAMGILIVFPMIAKLVPVVGEQQAGMAAFDASVPFVVVLGVIGAIVVLTYQTSVQYINVYLPSVNLSNIVAGLFGLATKRVWWVLIVNVVGFALVVGGAIDQVLAFSSYGALGIGMVVIISMADWVYGALTNLQRRYDAHTIRDWNPLSIITFLVSGAVAIYLWKTGFVASASIVGYPLCFVLYLALAYLTGGAYQQERVPAK
jgi:cytosine permease